jgi:single-strand DNA-binding protein
MGRLTRDPELRHTQTGTPVASFTIAVDRGFTPKDGGERQTDFIDIVTWRQTAEFVTKYFVKGQLAAVVGRLQIRDWTDKEGNKRRNAEVVAENVYFTGDRRDRGDRPAGSDSGYQSGGYQSGGFQSNYRSEGSSGGYSSPVESSGFSEIADDDGDLPF